MKESLLLCLPRFRRVRRKMRDIERWRQWTETERRAFQLDRLNAVWDHARRHSSYYRILAADLRLPPRFDSLDEFCLRMPLLERDTLRKRSRELLCSPAAPGFWAQTGGSTGVPTLIYKDREAHSWTLATQYAHRRRLGVDIFSPLAMVWGHSASFAPGLGGWLKRQTLPWEDRLRNRIRLSAYDLSTAALNDYLDKLRRFRPVLIYGYATALYLLADAAARAHDKWPWLKAIVSTSEVLTEPMRDCIESAFGICPSEEYGAIECGLMATSLTGSPLEIEEHKVWLEALPNESGTNDIVVTSLWNRSMPLLRYRLGDCCALPISETAIGYRTLSHILGRANDNLIGGDGRIVHSEAVSHILKYQTAAIRRFTVVQTADGAVTVHIESQLGAQVPLAELKRLFSELLQREVTVSVGDRLPASSAAGKHRWIVSHCRAATTASPPAP